MKGVNLRLPYLDSTSDKPSQKTDFMVEQTFTSVFSDSDVNSYQDSKHSLSSLRSFSTIGQEVPDRKQNSEYFYRMEEELKEKSQIIRGLHQTLSELKKLIRELQAEKY